MTYDCSGSLVNRYYVLTAAHCHTTSRPIAQVILGLHDFDSEPDCPGCNLVQRFDIQPWDVTVHERYVKMYYDWQPGFQLNCLSNSNYVGKWLFRSWKVVAVWPQKKFLSTYPHGCVAVCVVTLQSHFDWKVTEVVTLLLIT